MRKQTFQTNSDKRGSVMSPQLKPMVTDHHTAYKHPDDRSKTSLEKDMYYNQHTNKYIGGRQPSGSINDDEFEKLRENVVSFELPDGTIRGMQEEEKKPEDGEIKQQYSQVSEYYSKANNFVRKSTHHFTKISSGDKNQIDDQIKAEGGLNHLGSIKNSDQQEEGEEKPADYINVEDFITNQDKQSHIGEEDMEANDLYAEAQEEINRTEVDERVSAHEGAEFDDFDFDLDKVQGEKEIASAKVKHRTQEDEFALAAEETKFDERSLPIQTSIENESVAMLPKQIRKAFTQEEEDDKGGNFYPPGFTSTDDLNKDGEIDSIERYFKVETRKFEIKKDMEQKVVDDYMHKAKKEVDFHHKIAYRYEKAYRLTKTNPEKKQQLNMDIIEVIRENSDYIESDPMSMFYCLYFCIYYNNPESVEFLRSLILKMRYDHIEVINNLLDLIEVNGVQRLRTVGEALNLQVYHMVMYQAFEDNLRVVYQQIMRQLKFIQLRDDDALLMLAERDYELIQVSFTKYVQKINLPKYMKGLRRLRCHYYRGYTEAFFEECLIDYLAESRVAQNYRERFLTSNKALNTVLEMYCKNDFISHFLNINLDDISKRQIIELFAICLRNDSFKIGMLLYLKYLSARDFTGKTMDTVIESLKLSTQYHELKLFFIHQHFELMTITQMNTLVDICLEVLHRRDFKDNPVLSQYNTIKYSLLIYRISWKIEQRKIYSLITKCFLLNNYILNSLAKYLEKQHHIAQLYKFMREPVFHMSERKDSLDLMLEMDMSLLLNNPVIIEVLNLVYEGQYAIDLFTMELSETFQCLLQIDTFSIKSIHDRMISNVFSMGTSQIAKQSSLQFHIWKQCIDQRMQDEMLFTILFCSLILVMAIFVNISCNEFLMLSKEVFGDFFTFQYTIFLKATPDQLQDFCEPAKDVFLQLQQYFTLMNFLMYFTCLGFITSIFQKVSIIQMKDNVDISAERILLEVIIVASSITLMSYFIDRPLNPLITDKCKHVIELTESEVELIDFGYALISQQGTEIDFQMLLSLNVILFTMILIVMLQRSSVVGQLILMINEMLFELKRFFMTFGLVIGSFVVFGRLCQRFFKVANSDLFQISLDVFDGFVGNQSYEDYTFPNGKVFLTILVYFSSMLLLTFLVAMFNNRYRIVFDNLDFLKRLTIIKLKNSIAYDPFLGGITTSFFPMNIILLPFIVPILLLKNERLNDMILKSQYTLMMIFYCLIAITFCIPIIPILWIKSILNQGYIFVTSKRQAYRGEKVIKLILVIFTNPFLALVSLIVDILGLTSFLLKDEDKFQLKYRQSQDDDFVDIPLESVMKNFSKILYTNFDLKFKDKQMTLMTLMILHTKFFDLIENLHDLFCRGTKDYREALSNVQLYNMTKILTRKCSFPNESGDIKENICDFNVIHSVQMDIELFNYTEKMFSDYRSGKFKDDLRNKNKDYTQRFEKVLKERLDFNFETQISTLQGTVQRRVNSDAMNNFYIDIVAKSFTNIEEILKAKFENSEVKKQKETLKALDNVKKYWVTEVQGVAVANMKKFERDISSREWKKVKEMKDRQEEEKEEVPKGVKKQKKNSKENNGDNISQSTMVQPLDTIDEIAELIGDKIQK